MAGPTVTQVQPGGGTTVSNQPQRYTADGQIRKFYTVTGSGSYPTGGYALTPASFAFAYKLNFVKVINQAGVNNLGTCYWFWNRATQALQLIVLSTGAELANAQNDAQMTVDLEVEGN